MSSLAAFIPGSHRTEEDFSKILNDENGECRWPQPAAQLMSGKAGDCFINWTTVYHTRSPSSSTAPDRKTFWLVYRRDSQPHTRDYGRKQDQLTHAYVRGRREALEKGRDLEPSSPREAPREAPWRGVEIAVRGETMQPMGAADWV